MLLLLELPLIVLLLTALLDVWAVAEEEDSTVGAVAEDDSTTVGTEAEDEENGTVGTVTMYTAKEIVAALAAAVAPGTDIGSPLLNGVEDVQYRV